MNPLLRPPSAYIDALTLPELQAELVLAASRLVGTRVLPSGLSDEFLVCHECAGRGRERNAILHRDDCAAGWTARLLLAIAHAEAAYLSPTSPRKEPSEQENRRCEPIGAAAEEKRPFLLPTQEPRVCLKCGRTEAGWRYNRCLNCGEMSDPRPIAIPLPRQYGEPWTLSADGEVLNAEGHVIVDPHGCTLAEPDDLRAMRRIVASVNHCMGVPTDELCRETVRADADGGR